VTKKSKSKALKRQQRLRQLKGMERAADNLDKLELKVQKSVGKEKKVRERKKGWEDVNGEKRVLQQNQGLNAFEALESQDGGREWVSDEEMPEVEGAEAPVEGGAVKTLPVAGGAPLPAVEEDEML
jgi:hypothetical protein